MYNNKLQYSWSDYDKDIKSIEWLSFDHVIGIFRGSIGMAAHISNKHSVPMSIVGLQTRDADDKYPYWILNNTKAEMVPNQEPETNLIVDDIYETCRTMSKCIDFVKSCRTRPSNVPNILTYCLFGKDAPDGTNLVYSNKHEGHWIVFPWER